MPLGLKGPMTGSGVRQMLWRRSTQAGIERLEQLGFAATVADAVRAATERAHVLGAEAAKR